MTAGGVGISVVGSQMPAPLKSAQDMPGFIRPGTISGLASSGVMPGCTRHIRTIAASAPSASALGPCALAQAVSDGFLRALLCRPHRRGISGRDRYRDLDADAL